MAKGAQGPSKQQKRNEALQESLLRKQLAESSAMSIPEIAVPPPAPPAPPPPSGTSADQIEAGADAKRKAYQRTNAGRNTLFAGETGGFKQKSLGGNSTLLG